MQNAQVEHALKPGDRVRRTDSDRVCTVVHNESIFVALVQYLNGDEDWVSRDLLARIESTR